MPPGVPTGYFYGWKGWSSQRDAGCIYAHKAMVSAYTEAKRLGVKFTTDTPYGKVVALTYNNADAIGAQTADSTIHRADHIILAAGTGSDQLIDFKKQPWPTAWTLCHIPMTTKEAQKDRNLPLLNGTR